MMTFENLDKLTVLHYPNPILKKVSAPVEEFGEELVQLSRRMLEVMKRAPGIGLAAPQVGVLIRLFVCNITGEPDDDLVFVNPRFTELSGAVDCDEGCLSVPNVNVTKRRASHAAIEAMDATGKPFKMTGNDLLARVWQHETDHLDGRLISDNMSTADEIVNRRAIRQLKEEFGDVRPTRQV